MKNAPNKSIIIMGMISIVFNEVNNAHIVPDLPTVRSKQCSKVFAFFWPAFDVHVLICVFEDWFETEYSAIRI